MSTIDSPMPLSEIESVLSWVDTYKLTRPTKKINRDFADGVLLAEILGVHYPKLVEMHNYPPRNSHSLKLNNWMTLNRKVLKKLRLNLCVQTMEQLANSVPGVIERVLVMVRDKIRRDDEMNRSKEGDQNVSSGGSYYEAVGDDEHVLVIPVKTRVNGVLENIQQKVVNYELYLALKVELQDAKDASDLLKQKVEHLDNMLKLKEERIEELQKQLERKQMRRKEVETLQNNLSVSFEPSVPPTPVIFPNEIIVAQQTKATPIKTMDSLSKTKFEESRIPIPIDSKTPSKPSITEVSFTAFKEIKTENVKLPEALKVIETIEDKDGGVEKIELEIIEDKSEGYQDSEDFKDSLQDDILTIEDSIQKEIKEISDPMKNFNQDQKLSC